MTPIRTLVKAISAAREGLTKEPSHGGGAPEVPEPLTIEAQYLTRRST